MRRWRCLSSSNVSRTPGKSFDLLLGDGLNEGDDTVVPFSGVTECIGKLLETIDQRAPKTFEAITVNGNSGAFTKVELLTDLFRRYERGDLGRR